MDINQVIYIASEKTVKQEKTNRKEHKDELKLFRKVWSGFTKYIRSQCHKGRYFSCPFIGKFGPIRSCDSLVRKFCFIPSVDFIESAEYQFHENEYNCSPFANLEKEKIVIMSPTSIAQVCGTTKIRVIEVLKAIFSTIIELSKDQKPLCIDLKIGFLNIDKSKRLYFSNNQKQNSSIIQIINQKEDDNLTSLPKSIEGVSVHSYKSSFTTKRSVKTPLTFGKNSVKSKPSSKWSFFRKNNPRSQERHHSNAYSTINEPQLEYTSPLKIRTPSKSHQHLSRHLKKVIGYRFGKRMGKPANLTQKAVLAEQLQQIHDNNLKRQSEELQKRQEELKGCLTLVIEISKAKMYLLVYNITKIEPLHNDIERDEREKKIELINKRKEFLKEIESLK